MWEDSLLRAAARTREASNAVQCGDFFLAGGWSRHAWDLGS